MMKFRILIVKDPEADGRGYSLKGIKIPLTTWCPMNLTRDLRDLNGNRVEPGLYHQFWKVPCDLLIKSRPSLARHLRGLDCLAIPVDWCDIAPIEKWSEAWDSWQK